jgi:hypothetical protein
LLVNSRLVGRFDAANPVLEPYTFPLVPADGPQEVEVVLEVEGLLEPSASGASDDRRLLGIAVHEIWLE